MDQNRVRQSLPASVFTWLNSEKGRERVQEVVAKSHEAVETLNQARQVKPEQLHSPITL